jgi:Arc/MetJ-type ribon-helix-helix transcriptional regulator
MSKLDIHLPASVQTYLEQQIARRGYRDASEFIESLLEADRLQQLRGEIEAQVLAAVDGPFSDLTDKDFEDIEKAGDRILARRGASK